jgi:nicotinate-nucleotide pyrophosphorylase (carboxylating)
MFTTLESQISEIITKALIEDEALNDATSDLILSSKDLVNFTINNREKIIFCGREIISETFKILKKSPKFKNSKLTLKIKAKDGQLLEIGDSIASGHGEAKLIFAAERVILNLIQHLSGISTATNQFVTTLNNSKIKILDTRKTLPGLRALQKLAVKMGGAKNHRFNLSDMVLIKDNHIAAAGSVKNAVLLAQKNKKHLRVEVECDTTKQVSEAILANPDIIMLDNMSVAEIKKSSKLIRFYKKKKIAIEISGGVNLKNIKKFRNLDVDYISIGSLTHSVRAVDIGLDIVV